LHTGALRSCDVRAARLEPVSSIDGTRSDRYSAFCKSNKLDVAIGLEVEAAAQ